MDPQKSHYKQALIHLQKDPVMRDLIGQYASPRLTRNNSGIFLDLVETIINQQLSGKAADAILERFKKIFNGRIKPDYVLEISDQKLREAGLSFPKIRYIKGLCEKIVNQELDIYGLSKLSDEEVIKKLTSIKGIGPWSAEMMLIFSLKRPDVFSVGDLGLCKAVSKLYRVDRKDKNKIEKISRAWIPYRSTACWYLWRSLENG